MLNDDAGMSLEVFMILLQIANYSFSRIYGIIIHKNIWISLCCHILKLSWWGIFMLGVVVHYIYH